MFDLPPIYKVLIWKKSWRLLAIWN